MTDCVLFQQQKLPDGFLIPGNIEVNRPKTEVDLAQLLCIL